MPARIEITYCRRCKFMLRAAWMAQELLSSFEDDLSEVVIKPGSGGILEVTLDGDVIATNRDHQPMPDTSDVKRAIRDRIAPDQRVGHD